MALSQFHNTDNVFIDSTYTHIQQQQPICAKSPLRPLLVVACGCAYPNPPNHLYSIVCYIGKHCNHTCNAYSTVIGGVPVRVRVQSKKPSSIPVDMGRRSNGHEEEWQCNGNGWKHFIISAVVALMRTPVAVCVRATERAFVCVSTYCIKYSYTYVQNVAVDIASWYIALAVSFCEIMVMPSMSTRVSRQLSFCCAAAVQMASAHFIILKRTQTMRNYVWTETITSTFGHIYL